MILNKLFMKSLDPSFMSLKKLVFDSFEFTFDIVSDIQYCQQAFPY